MVLAYTYDEVAESALEGDAEELEPTEVEAGAPAELLVSLGISAFAMYTSKRVHDCSHAVL